MNCPEGPSTQDLKFLISENIKSMFFGTGDLKYWVLGSSRLVLKRQSGGPVMGRPEVVSFGSQGPENASNTLTQRVQMPNILGSLLPKPSE